MRQDPITTRFIQVFEELKQSGRVRSARQFALSIGTYAQSFNEILKGRREATLTMIQKVTEVYNINSNFLLTGFGKLERSEINGINTCPQLSVTFLKAHQFKAYASSVVLGNTGEHPWTKWEMPAEMLGQQIEIAFQCDTDRLSNCLGKGDILFARRVPRDAWKSNLSSKRIYVLALKDNIHIVGINNNDAEGIILKRDDRDLPLYINYKDIYEIWCPISKWTHNVMIQREELASKNLSTIDSTLKEQSESINKLRRTIQNLTSKEHVPLNY